MKHDKIDAYLLGEMSANEKAIFEGEMRNEPDLAEAVQRQRELSEAIHSEAAAERLRGVLAGIHREEETRMTQLPVFSWGKSIGIAAGIALLIGAAWWVWQSPAINAEQPLAEIAPVKVFSVERAADVNKIAEAANFYAAQKYDEAIKVLTVCLAQDSTAVDLWQFKGIAARELGDFATAHNSFQQIIQNENIPDKIRDENRLYEASVYFLEKDCAKLSEVIQAFQTNTYQARAAKLQEICQ